MGNKELKEAQLYPLSFNRLHIDGKKEH